eukprot:1156017-Pelagomonas_calceolata.AAC.10
MNLLERQMQKKGHTCEQQDRRKRNGALAGNSAGVLQSWEAHQTSQQSPWAGAQWVRYSGKARCGCVCLKLQMMQALRMGP